MVAAKPGRKPSHISESAVEPADAASHQIADGVVRGSPFGKASPASGAEHSVESEHEPEPLAQK